MFEAILTLCLSGAEGPCRDHLLPGYEAATQAECVRLLETNPPDLSVFIDLTPSGPAQCAAPGEILEFSEVSPGVFAHLGAVEEPDPENRGDVSNLAFVIGNDAVAVIDTGTARWMGEATWRAIRARTDLPVTHVILTHMHPDHIFGASVFQNAGSQILGHAHLDRAVADRQANYVESLKRLVGTQTMLGTQAVYPTQQVSDGEQIDIGGRVLTLNVWSASHTSTDITVYDEQSATLFAGDLIFDRHTPALDGNLVGWQQVLKEMARLPAERVVAGHGGPSLPWPDATEPMLRYLAVLERDTRAAIDAGQRLGDAVQTIAAEEAQKWELFEAYNPRNATVAFTGLEWE